MWSMLYRLIAYVCSWYTGPAGGAPFGPLVVLPALVVLLLAIWVCVGAAWEEVQDDRFMWRWDVREPLPLGGALALVLVVPIIWHQLPRLIHQPPIVWKFLAITEPYRFWISALILAATVGVHVVDQVRWRWARRKRRAPAGSIGNLPW